MLEEPLLWPLGPPCNHVLIPCFLPCSVRVFVFVLFVFFVLCFQCFYSCFLLRASVRLTAELVGFFVWLFFFVCVFSGALWDVNRCAKDDSGAICLDADPRYFIPILNFLRRWPKNRGVCVCVCLFLTCFVRKGGIVCGSCGHIWSTCGGKVFWNWTCCQGVGMKGWVCLIFVDWLIDRIFLFIREVLLVQMWNGGILEDLMESKERSFLFVFCLLFVLTPLFI